MTIPREKRDHAHDEVSLFDYVFKPRPLRRCINGVFRSDNNNTTDICLTSERTRSLLSQTELVRKRERISEEAEAFNACLCEVHSLSEHCRFNLSVVQDNSTVLEQCLDGTKENHPFHHAGTDRNFSCFLRDNPNRPNRVAVCKLLHPAIGPPARKETRVQYVFDCLSDSLKGVGCPTRTTVGPLTTTAPGTQQEVKIAMLVMALLISLLLGVLGTWLGVFCWRRRRRRRSERINRPLSPLMTRPEHASQPNLYDSEYGEDHIYDIVKSDESPSHPVPDLLSRVPSLPPMGDRTPRSKIHMDSGNGKAGFTQREDYEPLLRNQTSPDRDNTDPKTPVTSDDPPDYLPLLPDRNSREIPKPVKRVHPYDSINESEVEIEAVDESLTTPKLIDSPTKSPKAEGNDYFILEPSASKPRDKADDNSQQEKQTPEKIKEGDVETMELDNPNDSGFGVSPDCEPRKEGLQGTSDSEDFDGYEIPVPEKPTFDIASSFSSKGPRSVGDEDVVDV